MKLQFFMNPKDSDHSKIKLPTQDTRPQEPVIVDAAKKDGDDRKRKKKRSRSVGKNISKKEKPNDKKKQKLEERDLKCASMSPKNCNW